MRTDPLGVLEDRAREAYGDQYPKFGKQFRQGFQIQRLPGAPPRLSRERPGIQALQFRYADENQVVQVREQGFSFNRLAPYTSLDDYLPEIARSWRLFVELASPTQIRPIRLRYINRILLPLSAGGVDLDDYLRAGPRLPDAEGLRFVGFLDQHRGLEVDIGEKLPQRQGEAGQQR